MKKTAIAIFILFLAIGIEAAYAAHYADRILPGVHVGDIALGGLRIKEATDILAQRLDKLTLAGLDVVVEGQAAHLSLDTFSPQDPDLSRSIVATDVSAAVEEAFLRGRGSSAWQNLFLALVPLLERPNIPIPVSLDAAEFDARLAAAYPDLATEAAPTRFVPSKSSGRWMIGIAEGEDRKHLGGAIAAQRLLLAFSEADVEMIARPIEIPIITVKPQITLEAALLLVPDAETILAAAPYTITATDGGEYGWQLTDTRIAPMLVPTTTGVSIDQSLLNNYLKYIALDVDIEPRNAKIRINGSRADEFVPSRDGRRLNIMKSRAIVEQAVIAKQTEPIELEIETIRPDVSVADANTLGIKEMLGVGISNFAGSPANRIKNIKNGARLLNGVLIAPGETFSLLAALRPFTTENGYLPELVIKGDKITPEIGGGLCQIGTTTFRAAMNSGLPILARQNHSLVVSYYNDPSNHNPGTDATIYEPAPDFKFQNDTGGYILFATDVNDVTKELRFTLWGTSDGRRGSYSPPVVEKWIPAGLPRTTETADLPVGEKKCQSAHPGAVASFTYTVEKSDGTKNEHVFTSQYRALPEICLIGVSSEPPNPVLDQPIAE